MRRPGDLAIIAALVGATAVLAVARWPGADYRHSDFFQFWAAPRLLLEGADPYEPVPWADIYRREAAPPIAAPVPPYRFIYPPWTAVLLLPLGALPFDLAAAIWLVGQLAAVALALRKLLALVRGARREAVLLFGLAAAFQPLWLLVAGGNVTGLTFGFLVAATASVLAGAATRAGLAASLLAVKPHPFAVAAPALLAVARPPDRVGLIAVTGATGIALVAITLPFGPGLIGEWVSSTLELQATAGSNAAAWTLGRVLPGGPLVGPLCVAGALLALTLWWRMRDRPAIARVAAAVAVSVFVAPHGWSYDQLLLLVPLAVIVADTSALRGGRRSIALALTALVSGVLPWMLYALAFRRESEEWSAITPALFFGLLVLVERWSRDARGSAERPK
jgi:hypothetical protein